MSKVKQLIFSEKNMKQEGFKSLMSKVKHKKNFKKGTAVNAEIKFQISNE